MTMLTPDPTFYPSPTMATQSPPERLAYLAMINPSGTGRADARRRRSSIPTRTHGRLVGQTDMPPAGDELHHFGWNACSSCLCPHAPHPHMERLPSGRAWHQLVAHHILDKARSAAAADREDDRRRDARQRTGCGAAHRALRAGRHLHERAGRARRNGPGGTLSSTPRRSTCAADGSSIADRRSWPMTCGGTWASTRW